MKQWRLLPLLFLTLACAIIPSSPPTKSAPATDATNFSATSSLSPTSNPVPTPRFQFDDGQRSIVYDFTANLCEAKWQNNTDSQLLPCPGNLENNSKGYIGLLSGIEHGLSGDFSMMLSKPPNAGSGGLFGHYPAFRVSASDEFRASLTCRVNVPCAVEFSLAYYDENGQYFEPYPGIPYNSSDRVVNLILPLNGLANKTVGFVLAVRNIGNSASAWALWVAPRIVRP